MVFEGRLPTVSIEQDDSVRFGALSGDVNPLHLDPVHARRTIFGETVAHGIHVLLLAIAEAGREPLRTLQGRFSQPIRHGEPISGTYLSRGDEILIEVESQGRRAQSIVCGASDAAPFTLRPLLPSTDERHGSRGATGESGEVSLEVDLEIVADLFPKLMGWLPVEHLAVILATSRIVGMEQPGLYSLFIALDLRFSDDFGSSSLDRAFYRVARSDDRTGLVMIELEAPGVTGHLHAYRLAPPVDQPSSDTVAARVTLPPLTERRALVVGGSRGLGETTAKVLASAGADIVLTWNQGEVDATRVMTEIVAGRGRCRIAHLDLTNLPSSRPAGIEESWAPDLVFVFATPPITENRGSWDAALFSRYCQFYVEGVERLVSALHQWSDKPITLVYPSTEFIELPQSGFAEYAAAKAAGEVALQHLPARFAGLEVHAPRLPRTATDQIIGILPIESADPLDTVIEMMRLVGLSD